MRCLFIGLDAFDRDILLQGAACGDFPAFAQLMARGRTVETLTDPGTYVGSLWVTIHTGVDPSRHGLYCWSELEPGSYRLRPSDERNISVPSFWTRLSEAGHRVAVIDIPHCKLDAEINGVHVINWMTHFKTEEGFVTAPPDLAGDIEKRFGLDPVPHCNAIDHSPEGISQFTEAMLRRVERRTQFGLELIAARTYDLVAVGFGESHCAGHQCFHLHMPGSTCADDPMLRVYRAIDGAVGRLVDACPDDCAVVVLASHGIGPHYDGSHLAGRLIRKVDRRLKISAPVPVARRMLDVVDGNRIRRFLGPASRLLPPELPRSAHARAFMVPNNEAALGIRVNLIGREPAGLVALDDFDRYLDALESVLMTARRPQDGSRAFTESLRTSRHYRVDPRQSGLPDLMLTWDRSRPYVALEVPGYARVVGDARCVRTGDHKAGGLAVFAGPAGHNSAGSRVDSADIAHHMLAMFGVCDVPTRAPAERVA